MDDFNSNDPAPNLCDVLDKIVDEVMKEYPEKTEFEAAFMAIQTHLGVVASLMAMTGLRFGGLNEKELYMFTSTIVQSCQWMTAKQLAADAMRDIEKL